MNNSRIVRSVEGDSLKEKVVAINRVAKVVKGGRRFSFSAIVVVGDGNGIVGYGLGKANEVTDAIQKGIDDAKKNLVKIPMYKHTVPHANHGKYSGGFVFLKPAAPGTGIIAGGTLRKVVELTGIKDILSKSFGTTNKIACSRAALEALKMLKENPYMQKAAAKELAKRQAQQQPKQDQKPVKKQEKPAKAAIKKDN